MVRPGVVRKRKSEAQPSPANGFPLRRMVGWDQREARKLRAENSVQKGTGHKPQRVKVKNKQRQAEQKQTIRVR